MTLIRDESKLDPGQCTRPQILSRLVTSGSRTFRARQRKWRCCCPKIYSNAHLSIVQHHHRSVSQIPLDYSGRSISPYRIATAFRERHKRGYAKPKLPIIMESLELYLSLMDRDSPRFCSVTSRSTRRGKRRTSGSRVPGRPPEAQRVLSSETREDLDGPGGRTDPETSMSMSRSAGARCP
jgi:hypothetical protein